MYNIFDLKQGKHEMKFSKETIAILKNFATINSGVVLNPGNHIMTRSATGATHSEATIEETIDTQLAIIDLNGFLNILSMSDEDAEVTTNQSGDIVIKNAKSEINWPATDASMVVVPKRAIQFPDAQVKFDLTADDYNQLMRVSRALGCDTLIIKSKNGKIVIGTYNKLADSELNKELFTMELGDYDGAEFNFIINIGNMKLLPDSYEVQLWAKDKMFAAKFAGTLSSYVIAVEMSSEHSFA